MYAIGGSANPTILSQGNRFMASAKPSTKEVTKRQNAEQSKWKNWNWRSEDDVLLNDAYFTQSGSRESSAYATAYSTTPKSSALVGELTRNAGVLSCKKGTRC
jgi:pectate lyase